MFPGFKNQYLRFSLNLLILFLIVFLLDRVSGTVVKRLYFSQVAGANYRTTYSIDSTRADILVFGSSRANHHYVPEIFEDSLKMSFYNTGRDGNFLLYNFAVFKTIIKRYSPKIIILDINANELYYNKENYDRLSSLLPYYYDHPEIQSIVKLRSPYEKLKLSSAIYPYNSSLLTILMSNLEANKHRKSDRNGYIPLFGSMKDTSMGNINDPGNSFDSTNINALKSISKTCKLNNILLIFIQSPIYSNVKDISSTKVIAGIAKENNAIFLDYFNNKKFNNKPSYFKDGSHLNDEGAKIFSKEIANQILRNSDFNHYYNLISGKFARKYCSY